MWVTPAIWLSNPGASLPGQDFTQAFSLLQFHQAQVIVYLLSVNTEL
jgi:hypothetical protein